MKKIAVINQKGGVGKTTTTVNLGVALAKRGYRVLLVDFDPQANTTTHLGFDEKVYEKTVIGENEAIYHNVCGAIEALIDGEDYEDIIHKSILHHEEGVDLIPSCIELATLETKLQAARARETKLNRLLKVVENDYDICLIDCQPSLNILPINAMTAADLLLVPVATQGFATQGLKDLIVTSIGVKVELNSKLDFLGILFTFAEANTIQTKNAIQQVTEMYKDELPIFKTIIPKAVVGGMAASTGHSLFYKNGSSTLAQRYIDLADEVIDMIKEEE